LEEQCRLENELLFVKDKLANAEVKLARTMHREQQLEQQLGAERKAHLALQQEFNLFRKKAEGEKEYLEKKVKLAFSQRESWRKKYERQK